MKAVWKFPIGGPRTALGIPSGARILDIQVQDNEPQLWVLVNPENAPVIRTFQAVATGQHFDDSGCVYIGTFQINGGRLVFHLFENVPMMSVPV